ncbi:hypothetical protein L1987_79656 [Smallanthus sonchifolius]|uniref:Uncharacterized protein n=1 Tax=Smallanthus sonchifolius TaxID=185202 RepID=A0ACB8YJS7_9ASTR|nr:hypothetical protein L1987_79656 [Smallanthus sonchifolius]
MVMLSRTIAASQSLPGCSDKCGNITIPYPFGIEEGCYLDLDYRVDCTALQWFASTFELLDISLDGSMRGVLPVAYACYNSTHQLSGSDTEILTGGFTVSSTTNLLYTVGCDTRADIMTIEGEYSIVAGTTRSECDMVSDGLYFGDGSSRVPIPYTMPEFLIRSQRNTGKVGNWSFNNCSYAFISQSDQYTFHKTDIDNMLNRSFPVVLEWSVDVGDCEHAQTNKTRYLCKENSVCIDSQYGGYNCHCAPGYQGNPYLPNGCQDVNECEGALNDCIYGTYGCVNTNGSYNCFCPFGKSGDGREHGSGCSYLQAAKSHGNPLYIGANTYILMESFIDWQASSWAS